MSDHHRYYKDSYGASSSKRYHSPSDASRLGLSGDYYDASDSRSKRSRTDSYGTHTSTSRYADYPTSSSGSGGSRYKAATSSSSYYDLQGYKPSTSSSSSSKYLDDYKGSGSSSRSAPKSNVRRVPPPLTPPCLSSKSSSLRLQPLMKVSLSTSSSVGSSSGKDYYGSRMRQAPPEHHYSYSGSHSSTSYSKAEFKRPVSYTSSSRHLSSSGYHAVSRPHGTTAAYRSSAVASSRKLLARSRVPASSNALSSRIRGRSTLISSRRDDDSRKRRPVVTSSLKRESKRSHSGSGGEDRVKSPSKDKKDEEEVEKNQEKKVKKDQEIVDYASIIEGQMVVEEVAGDDEDDELDDSGNLVDRASSTVSTEKNESMGNLDDQQKGGHDADDEANLDGKANDGVEKVIAKGSEEKPYASRALLKLHCPYCDVRCISFREFTFHLKSSTHTRTMFNVVSDMKKKLGKIRLEMKEDQRKREKEEKVLSDTSSYCRVCELSFRTDPKEHEANEIHNKIKALIYRRCDVCDIDFRIWKVHIYHMAALEHAKRVAMKELQEREAKGDNVKGTNLSQEELGLNLVEIRTVFYCNACIRYIPIKGDTDEARKNHCMTLNHLKCVEDFNERERRRALREEARDRARRRKQEEEEKHQKSKDANVSTGEKNKTTDADSAETGNKTGENGTGTKSSIGDTEDIQIEQVSVIDTDGENKDENSVETHAEDKEAENTKTTGETSTNEGQETNQNEAEEDDDDEIELHAGEDDVEDESEDAGDWSRRTRSSQRGDGSSK